MNTKTELIITDIEEKDASKIEELSKTIDIKSTTSIMHFGVEAQERVTTASSSILKGVKNKDLEGAAAPLSNMIVAIKGFDINELDPNKKPGFFDKLLGKAKPLALFLSKYEGVKEQIESIADELEKQKGILLNDIESLDRLYDANLDYVYQLEEYIVAGEQKLSLMSKQEIPAMKERVESSSDMIAVQELKDLHGAKDDFERRVHDLKLTRQVALQSLPSIRMVQENDKTLVNKISSTLINTLPLWKNQLAQTITIYRNQKAGEVLSSAMDLTNELLEANAKNLKESNRQTRELAERGVFDIESIKLANQLLIETIEDSINITSEGKKARAEAEEELKCLEQDLKNTLLKMKSSSYSTFAPKSK